MKQIRICFFSGGNEERLLQTADFALLLTNTRDADGIGGEVDGVDPLRNPGTFRCGWLAKNKKGAFTHELGHLLGARSVLSPCHNIRTEIARSTRPIPTLGLVPCGPV